MFRSFGSLIVGSLLPLCALSLLSLASVPAAGAQEPLKLSVHPYLASSDLVKRFTPLADHLSRELKRPVSVEISSTYEEQIKKTGQGHLDIAFLGPASYVSLTETYGSMPLLAAFRTKDGKVFRGHIMVRKDSPVTSLVQLKGKRFVFGDPNSTMSHMVPRHMLLKNGITVNDFSQVSFVANHDNIAMSILAGTYDAGAVKEEIFLKYEPQGLRSLARSAPVADHVFVASAGLPKETVDAIRHVLLRLSDSEEGRRIIAGLRSDVVALVPADDADFASLRSILRDLNKAGIR